MKPVEWGKKGIPLPFAQPLPSPFKLVLLSVSPRCALLYKSVEKKLIEDLRIFWEGYTLPYGSNAFFEKCPGLQIAMYVQMVWSMMFNAFLFAFFYTSLAKSSARGIQVLFSNKAIVSTEGDQVRLQIRIYDLDPTHPVVEAHVRLYAWTKHRPVPRPLRLLQPNDELGALLYMSMPTVVTHHIDTYSMLHPTSNVEFPVAPSGLVVRAFLCRFLYRRLAKKSPYFIPDLLCYTKSCDKRILLSVQEKNLFARFAGRVLVHTRGWSVMCDTTK
jgi:hypothetical protein